MNLKFVVFPHRSCTGNLYTVWSMYYVLSLVLMMRLYRAKTDGIGGNDQRSINIYYILVYGILPRHCPSATIRAFEAHKQKGRSDGSRHHHPKMATPRLLLTTTKRGFSASVALTKTCWNRNKNSGRTPLFSSSKLPPPLSLPSRKGQRLLSSQKEPKQQNQHPPKWVTMGPVMVVPIMFIAWGVSNWIFGNRELKQTEALRNEFLAQQQQQQQQGSDAATRSDEVLCYCVVRRDKGFAHSMTGIVKVGDVLEVYQEGVGPNGLYNLCRLPADPNDPLAIDTWGWFPTRWLQKLEDYEAMLREHSKASTRSLPTPETSP